MESLFSRVVDVGLQLSYKWFERQVSVIFQNSYFVEYLRTATSEKRTSREPLFNPRSSNDEVIQNLSYKICPF